MIELTDAEVTFNSEVLSIVPNNLHIGINPTGPEGDSTGITMFRPRDLGGHVHSGLEQVHTYHPTRRCQCGEFHNGGTADSYVPEWAEPLA